MEGIQEGVAGRKVPLDGKRTAGHDGSHDGLAGGLQGLQKLALGPDQVQVGQGMGLAGKDGFLAQEHQHHVGTAGSGHHVVKTVTLLPAVHKAGDIAYLPRKTLPEGLQRGNRVRLFAVKSPGTQLVVRSVGHGAGDQDIPNRCRLQRKHAVVFEQDGRLFGRFPCGLQMLRRILHGGSGLHVDVGVFEQSQKDLHPEDIADGLVDVGFADGTAADQFFQVRHKAIGHHVHIHTGLQGLLGHVFPVFAEPVDNHLAHGVPVGDHQSVKAPFSSKDVLHHKGVARGRNPVIVVEGGHQGHGARFYRGLERRQVSIAQLAFGEEGAVVVTAAFGSAIAYEMLDAGRHGRGIQGMALVTVNHGFRHAGIQVSVLSAALCHASPTRVAGDVQHGRERPADTLRSSLQGGHTGALLHQGGVEGGRQAQGNREYGMEAVNHVTGHKKRNAQTGLLYADSLELVDFHGIHLVQDRAYLALPQRIGIIGHVASGRDLVHLADFLGQGHLGEDSLHFLFHFGTCPHGGDSLLLLTRGRHHDKCRQV